MIEECYWSKWLLFCLEDEVAAIHGVVEVVAAEVFDAAWVEIEGADVGVVDAGAGRLDQIRAVGGRHRVQGERVLALCPGEAWKRERQHRKTLRETGCADLPPLQTPLGRVDHPHPWPQGSAHASVPFESDPLLRMATAASLRTRELRV